MSKILVTPRSITRDGHHSLQKLEQAGFEVIYSEPGRLPTESELLELLPGCVGYLAGVETVTPRVLEAATDLRAISRNGVGANSIDYDAAERLGIPILLALGSNARGVAELTASLMMSLLRSITMTDRALKSGRWERFPGYELEGRTLGLLGCGRIGRMVSTFASAFGMKVLAHDPFLTWDTPPEGFAYATPEVVFTQSDILSLHCPPAKGNRSILNADTLAQLKHGAFVINTARGELIDDEAMLAALESGQVAGLALDAYIHEPPSDRRLMEHPHVIATSHIGGYTQESIDRAMHLAVDNLLEAIQKACRR